MASEPTEMTTTQSPRLTHVSGDESSGQVQQTAQLDDAAIAHLDGEAAKLHAKATRVLGFLVVLGSVNLAGVVALTAAGGIDTTLLLLLIGVAAGTAGSCAAAAISVAERRAEGYEIAYRGGIRLWATDPDNDTGRFSLAMLPFFYLRPFLGATAGVLAYGGIRTGLLFSTATQDDALGVVLFFALLSGLFAKSLFDSLRRAFKGLVGQ